MHVLHADCAYLCGADVGVGGLAKVLAEGLSDLAQPAQRHALADSGELGGQRRLGSCGRAYTRCVLLSRY
jgi:hypothetical protein